MIDTDKKEGEWPDEDKVIFIPDEYIRDIESTLDKLETARQEFRRVLERVKRMDS
jgi:hypothetical protein